MAQGHTWRSLSALTLSHGSGNDNFTLWAVLELCALRNENGLVTTRGHDTKWTITNILIVFTYSIYPQLIMIRIKLIKQNTHPPTLPHFHTCLTGTKIHQLPTAEKIDTLSMTHRWKFIQYWIDTTKVRPRGTLCAVLSKEKWPFDNWLCVGSDYLINRALVGLPFSCLCLCWCTVFVDAHFISIP